MSTNVDECRLVQLACRLNLDHCVHTVQKHLFAVRCHMLLLSQSGLDFNPCQSGMQSTPCLVRRRAAMVETHKSRSVTLHHVGLQGRGTHVSRLHFKLDLSVTLEDGRRRGVRVPCRCTREVLGVPPHQVRPFPVSRASDQGAAVPVGGARPLRHKTAW